VAKIRFIKRSAAVSIVVFLFILFLGVFLYSTLAVPPATEDALDAEEEPNRLFDIQIEYAYAESQSADGVSEDEPVFYVVLNYTLISEVDSCDAIYEVHQIEVYSDKGSIGNVTKAQGIMFNHSVSTLMQGMSLNFDEFADYGDVTSGASGGWPVNESALQFFVGEKTSIHDFGDVETIYVRVRRLGLITLKDGSSEVVVLSEPEVVAQTQLHTFGDGFLYNNIIPEDQLEEIDLFNPAMWIFSN